MREEIDEAIEALTSGDLKIISSFLKIDESSLNEICYEDEDIAEYVLNFGGTS